MRVSKQFSKRQCNFPQTNNIFVSLRCENEINLAYSSNILSSIISDWVLLLWFMSSRASWKQTQFIPKKKSLSIYNTIQKVLTDNNIFIVRRFYFPIFISNVSIFFFFVFLSEFQDDKCPTISFSVKKCVNLRRIGTHCYRK